MTSRFRLAFLLGPLTLAGCGDSFNAGPMKYIESEQLAVTLKGKPKLQDAVRKSMANLFGESPQKITVPFQHSGIRSLEFT